MSQSEGRDAHISSSSPLQMAEHPLRESYTFSIAEKCKTSHAAPAVALPHVKDQVERHLCAEVAMMSTIAAVWTNLEARKR